MTTLSKSKLIAYRQCPKRLWLEIHKPELRDDSGSEAVFAIGNEVGAVAQQIYDPAGIVRNIDPNLIGWDEAYAQTADLLTSGERPVFEAALRIPGALAQADVMLPDTSFDELHWRMLEVKSSTGVKDYHRDDAAIQTYIAEKSGIRLSQVGIAHINNQFVYPGDGNYEGLLHIEDLTVEVKGRHAEVAQWIADAQKTVVLESEPMVDVGPHCSDPFTCGFCDYCWKDVVQPENPTSLLPRIRSTKLAGWEAQGIVELKDAPEHEINAIQLRVKECTLEGTTYFDAKAAADSVRHGATPTYFLDFETVSLAVPRWVGTRPYQQLPFQYSLHRVDEDGALHHLEFLDTSGLDPRKPLAEQLIQDCGSCGVIYAYNSGFEKGVLSRLALEFPEYAAQLNGIIRRVDDLLPIARKYYYHPSQRGGWGLKAVLPAICPVLSYGDLEDVQDGMGAGLAYLEAIAPQTTPERKSQLRHCLLKYCELDTLATVRIWEFFK